MSSEVSIYKIASIVCVFPEVTNSLLDCSSDLPEGLTGLADRDSHVHGFACGLALERLTSSYEFEDILVDVADHDHGRVVAVKAILKADYVAVDEVAVLEAVVVWHAVRHYVVHRRAEGLGKAMEVDG